MWRISCCCIHIYICLVKNITHDLAYNEYSSYGIYTLMNLKYFRILFTWPKVMIQWYSFPCVKFDLWNFYFSNLNCTQHYGIPEYKCRCTIQVICWSGKGAQVNYVCPYTHICSMSCCTFVLFCFFLLRPSHYWLEVLI